MEKETWKIFKLKDKELCAYTIRGTFEGEEQSTLEMLASENRCDISDITVEAQER